MSLLDGVRWIPLRTANDKRGALTVIEGGRDVPFPVHRVFFVHSVPPGVDRGGHAHRDTDQCVVAVTGSVRLELSDGHRAFCAELDRPEFGLLLPRMVWTQMREFSPGAVFMALASTQYDVSRSIRNWDAYVAARGLPPMTPSPLAEVLPRPVP